MKARATTRGPRHQVGALLAILRIILAGGLLLAAGVVWALRREAGVIAVLDPESVRALRIAGLVAWGLAVVGVALLTALLATRRTPPTHAMVLGGWLAAELPAIYGLVRWSVTDNPRWALLGLVFAIGVLVVYPPRTTGGTDGASHAGRAPER